MLLMRQAAIIILYVPHEFNFLVTEFKNLSSIVLHIFFQTIILLIFFFIQRLFRMGQSFELIVWIRCTWCAKAAKLADKSKWVPRTANERLRVASVKNWVLKCLLELFGTMHELKSKLKLLFHHFISHHPNLFVTVTASLGWLHCNYNKRRRSIKRTTRMRVSR